MTRRRFLGFLGLAPVVVSAAIRATSTTILVPRGLGMTVGHLNPILSGEFGVWHGVRLVTAAHLPGQPASALTRARWRLEAWAGRRGGEA